MKTVTVIEMQTRLCELQAQQGIEVTQVTLSGETCCCRAYFKAVSGTSDEHIIASH